MGLLGLLLAGLAFGWASCTSEDFNLCTQENLDDPACAPFVQADPPDEEPPVTDPPDEPPDEPDPVVPCGGPCAAQAPFCDLTSNSCVACLRDADCSGSTSLCSPTTQACVACVSNSQCTALTASACDGGSCAPCDADADCSHLAATPVCEASVGRCVECTAATEATQCGANTCSLLSNECTSTTPGSTAICESCESHSECAAGARCASYMFETTQLGPVCLRQPDSGGSCFVAGQIGISNVSGSGVDSIAVDVCIPEQDKTTCEAMLAEGDGCTLDSQCGVSNIDDSVCVDYSGPPDACAPRCVFDAACISGSCEASVGSGGVKVCEP